MTHRSGHCETGPAVSLENRPFSPRGDRVILWLHHRQGQPDAQGADAGRQRGKQEGLGAVEADQPAEAHQWPRQINPPVNARP